jgi:hypothetical protein
MVITFSKKAKLSFVCFFLAGVACAQVQSGSTVPAVETILTRMAQARAENRAGLRPYTVTRDYWLFGKEKHSTTPEVIADLTFTPPDVKRYAIWQASGTGLGEKIVRQMLEHEVELVRNYSSTEISTANYDFRFIGEENAAGERCYVLELLPLRKDKNLLRGKIWVDTGTYLLRRAEGEPAKAVSWYLRDVRIALVYADVGGMWLQTSSESSANVRLLGQHTMLSRDLEYKISELTAAAGASASGPATLSARPELQLLKRRSFPSLSR